MQYKLTKTRKPIKRKTVNLRQQHIKTNDFMTQVLEKAADSLILFSFHQNVDLTIFFFFDWTGSTNPKEYKLLVRETKSYCLSSTVILH